MSASDVRCRSSDNKLLAVISISSSWKPSSTSFTRWVGFLGFTRAGVTAPVSRSSESTPPAAAIRSSTVDPWRRRRPTGGRREERANPRPRARDRSPCPSSAASSPSTRAHHRSARRNRRTRMQGPRSTGARRSNALPHRLGLGGGVAGLHAMHQPAGTIFSVVAASRFTLAANSLPRRRRPRQRSGARLRTGAAPCRPIKPHAA